MKTPARLARSFGLAVALAALPAAAADPPGAPVPVPAPAGRSVVLLPTLVTAGGALHAPQSSDLGRLAQSLDALLGDTAQDLGLAVVPARGPGRYADRDLVERARAARALVILPSLRRLDNGDLELRLALAGPGAPRVDARTEIVPRADLAVRAVVLLRDLVRRHGRPASRPPVITPIPLPRGASTWTAGRISLLANGTLFGGLVGYSIQRGSGSSDPRLLYPLLAVGAGIGFGASLVVSGEWETSTGDAWYFAAGAWWPSAAGHLLFEGRFAANRPDSERWIFGLLGGTVGATLATLGLALRGATPGDAVMAHSGGGLGLGVGALLEMAVRGEVHRVPYSGMGYGAAFGWLAAAAVATQLEVSPLRVLAFDAGVALGGLAGAGLASPLLMNSRRASPAGMNAPSAGKQRAFAGIAAGSAIAGGVVAAILVRPRRAAPLPSRLPGLPMLGVLGESRFGAVSAPIYGVGWSGVLD